MVSRIQQLPPLVANQIAAGEVIERPSSVVKELLENALDAGADNIQLEVNCAGLTLIRVSDNGSGIVANDLPLAIAAHATSKINKLNDLYSIQTMGFRGEAIASISSVSKLKITSKPEEQEHAASLVVEEDAFKILPCARTRGTTIEVRDLFFNAPVRKKFLKSENVEFQAIETVVKRFALSAPHITICLKHNNKEILLLPAAKSSQSERLRIKKVLGKNFIEQSGFLEIQRAGITLRGWVSGENYQRSQNDKQWIYVNQRMVKDKIILHAVKQAYEGLIYPGKHPSCLLFLTIPPHEVDVNVHPTKHEVRFQDPRLVHDLVTTQIVKVLKYSPLEEKIRVEKDCAKEIYSHSSFTELTTTHTASNIEWRVINPHFILLQLNKLPLLIRYKSLIQHIVYEQLVKTELPLVGRPLLVPIRFAIAECKDMDKVCKVLSDIGIELQLVGLHEGLIRTIPLLLPYLKIQDFLAQFFKKICFNKNALFMLLSQFQEMDPSQINENEQATLLDFITKHYRTSDWCVELTEEFCHGLFPKRNMVHD